MHSALMGLRRELGLLGAANVVITSDLPLRGNGNPYGNAADSGVAVWFVHQGNERVFACDRWMTAADNIHAIALSISAIRGMERWGASDIVTRAFSGFAALPSGSGDLPSCGGNGSADWRTVLGVPDGSPCEQLANAKRNHRALLRSAHPDTGGSTEQATTLNVAMDTAERAIAQLRSRE
jgi:hypothetical protein